MWFCSSDWTGKVPKGNKIHPPKDMHKNVDRSFIYTSPNLETIQMSISSRTDRSTVACSHNGILLCVKEEEATCGWISQTVLSERSQMQKCASARFHLYEVEEETKQIYGDRIQNRGKRGY